LQAGAVSLAPELLEHACADLEKAVEQQRRALELNDREPRYRRDLTGHCRNLARAYVLLGRPREAGRTLDRLAGLSPPSSPDAYQNARFMAWFATEARRAGRAPGGGHEQVVKVCSERALGLLEKLVEAGHVPAARLKQGPYFNPLRDTPRFRDLVARKPGKPSRSP
jgi:hypothetical protein